MGLLTLRHRHSCLSVCFVLYAVGRAERWSVVFFTRPGDSVILCPLAEESPLIAAAVAQAPSGKFETGVTAKDWFARRTKHERIRNRTGPETWREGRGMEHEPSAK
ncbi:hypothetical protein B0H21DRAFT_501675 [Amylocystis lapponica]|nr:hypothetical protein B0H21DRAFT_501675 [Amylocystis lapponica]